MSVSGIQGSGAPTCSQSASAPLSAKERAEMRRLGSLWATGRATTKQMNRFRSLEYRGRQEPLKPRLDFVNCRGE